MLNETLAKHPFPVLPCLVSTSTALTPLLLCRLLRSRALDRMEESSVTLSSSWDLSASSSPAGPWVSRFEELDTTNMLLKQRIVFLGSQVAYTFDTGPNAVLIARDRKTAAALLRRLLFYFPPPEDELTNYVLGDQSILHDAGLKERKDAEALTLPPELKDHTASSKLGVGDVSYFICTKPGSGPIILKDEHQVLLSPKTRIPR